jgi:two-component system, cell cycle sensor histidine kinase and response regulator CckA
MNRTQGCGSPVSLSAREEYASQRTILFVDDEPDLLTARRLLFEFMGYSVLTAESGQEALELLRSKKVDAVVVDYMMPGMDGEETARGVRNIRPNLPIVLSSGCLSVPQSVLDKVDASVNKGVQQEKLFEVLERQLTRAAYAQL